VFPRVDPIPVQPVGAAQVPPEPFIGNEPARYRAAAFRATRLHPGPVGDLLARELRAVADFGYRVAPDSLVARAAATLLATPLP